MAIAIGIKVRFFARLRELAGVEIEAIQTSSGSTLSDVYAALRNAHPHLPEPEGVRGALNAEFADWTAEVSDGDEVAFIPPVSGGSAR